MYKIPHPSELENRFQQPYPFQWDSFERESGRTIRFGYNIPPSLKPDHIVIDFPGLNDPIEKQFEAYRHLEIRNIAVFAMEWMGQGGSARYFGKGDQRRHSDNFDKDVMDAVHFLNKIVLPTLVDLNIVNQPKILKAHSMGGHLGLRMLSNLSSLFDKAVITAPMVEIARIPISYKLRLNTASMLCDTLGEDRYAPFSGDWKAGTRARRPGSDRYSASPSRSILHDAWMSQNPVGGPTNKWVYDAHRSIENLRDEFSSIRTPTIIGVAGNDYIVDSEATLKLCQGSDFVKTQLFGGARHEIWNERDTYRKPMMDQLFFPHSFDV